MDPITVPKPPNTAFNKNRRMSDLIKKQVEHFKHLEQKLPPEIRASLPQHAIVSEGDAARYIGPMTRYFLSRQATVRAKTPIVMRAPAALPQAEEKGLALAAAAEAAHAPEKKTSTRGPKKSSAARKRKK